MEDKITENRATKDEVFIQFVLEVLADRKRDSLFWKILYIILAVLLAICIGGMAYFGIYCQDKLEKMADRSEQRMYSFLSEYDLSSEIDLDTGTITESDNSGNINFNQSR